VALSVWKIRQADWRKKRASTEINSRIRLVRLRAELQAAIHDLLDSQQVQLPRLPWLPRKAACLVMRTTL